MIPTKLCGKNAWGPRADMAYRLNQRSWESIDFSSLFLSHSSEKLHTNPGPQPTLKRDDDYCSTTLDVGAMSCCIQEFVRLCFVIYLLIDGFEVFVKLVI